MLHYIDLFTDAGSEVVLAVLTHSCVGIWNLKKPICKVLWSGSE